MQYSVCSEHTLALCSTCTQFCSWVIGSFPSRWGQVEFRGRNSWAAKPRVWA